MESIVGLTKRDTRSLDSSSYNVFPYSLNPKQGIEFRCRPELFPFLENTRIPHSIPQPSNQSPL